MDNQQTDYKKWEDEREISLGEVMREVFRRFPLVIIMAVICAVIAGGYSYMHSGTDTAEEVVTTEDEIATDDLTEDELTAVNNVLKVQENLDEQQEYVNNSILMQINAYDESTVILQYHIDIENSDDIQLYGQDLLDSYESYVTNGALVSDFVSNGYDEEEQYLGELISFNGNVETTVNNSLEGTVSVISSVSFDIQVIHTDEQSVEALAEQIESCLKNYEISLCESVGDHTLTLVNHSCTKVVDKSLWTYKTERISSISSMQNTLESLQEDMTDDQLAVLGQYITLKATEGDADEVAAEDGETVTAATPSVSKKYLALGAIVGIVLAILYIFLRFIMSKSFNSAEELRDVYSLRILGEVKRPEKKNIFLKAWDKLTGHRESALSAEEEKSILISNLKNVCKEKQIGKILISGDRDLPEEDQALVQDLIEDLSREEIAAVYADNLIHSAEMLDLLAKQDAVLFVERARVSRRDVLEEQFRVCDDYSVAVLGAVVIS
ncbi:MAG: hypothetical protein LIO96_03265 [Lachnospiraceae bacterium]|nr:hypothetical protein [Lachnospiraceae bacterium]